MPEVFVFDMSIAEFEQISLTLCIGGLVLMMIFILYRLGRDSGAGRFGTFILFLSLGMGIFGFAAKSVIKLFIDI
jgi:small-conductance mechanosensitive channel